MRSENANLVKGTCASRWARQVIRLDAAARIKNGAFSQSKRQPLRRKSLSAVFVEVFGSDEACHRRKGQKSSKRRTKGKVTSIGLAMSPSANKSSERA